MILADFRFTYIVKSRKNAFFRPLRGRFPGSLLRGPRHFFLSRFLTYPDTQIVTSFLPVSPLRYTDSPHVSFPLWLRWPRVEVLLAAARAQPSYNLRAATKRREMRCSTAWMAARSVASAQVPRGQRGEAESSFSTRPVILRSQAHQGREEDRVPGNGIL